jgi:hypothetical protein
MKMRYFTGSANYPAQQVPIQSANPTEVFDFDVFDHHVATRLLISLFSSQECLNCSPGLKTNIR